MPDRQELMYGTAQEIMKLAIFKTTSDNETIYMYNKELGIYQDNAESYIKTISQRMLGEQANTFLVNGILDTVARSTLLERKNFDSIPNIACVRNGVLDLVTSELKPHSPEYLLLRQLPVKYNSGKSAKGIGKFLDEVVSDNDKKLIVQFLGFLLTNGYKFHKALLFVGSGNNGKTTLAEVIRTFLGANNVSTVSLQDLCNDRFASSDLYGKLANIKSELSAASVKEIDKFKLIVGGDMIDGQRKYKDRFHFYNNAKVIFTCNEIPQAPNADDAYYNRWIIVYFPNKFVGSRDNTNLREQLTIEDEMSGLLNMALVGYKELITNNRFAYDDDPKSVKKQYCLYSSDTINRFVRDRLSLDSDKWITKEEIYKSYKLYCIEEGEGCKEEIGFWRRMEEVIHVKERESYRVVQSTGKRAYGLNGIKIIGG